MINQLGHEDFSARLERLTKLKCFGQKEGTSK